MIYIKADSHVWQFTSTSTVWSNRRQATVPICHLTRECAVCSAPFTITQVLPTYTRRRAEELLAEPPRGISGYYPRRWSATPPVKDKTFKVPLRGSLSIRTCREHRGQAHLAKAAPRELSLQEQIEALV